MKILLCDDKCLDDVEFQKFLDDWDLRKRRDDVLRAIDDQSALEYLKTESGIGLLILDLLWGDQPEHETVIPTGIRILERVRSLYPALWIVTRSRIEDQALLSRLVQSFVQFRVSDHFRSPDRTPTAMLRKHVIVEMIDQVPPSTSAVGNSDTLKSFLGDHWATVMFADISGFTSVTEQLWYQNRVALCSALADFYGRAGQLVNEHEGIIDKFIGDELMAIFFQRRGETKTDTSIRAVDCARALVNSFRELEFKFKKAMASEDDVVRQVEWKLKVGMDAGALRIMEQGLPNGETEYCAVGKAINFASRIKSLAGPYGVTLGESLRRNLTNDPLYACELLSINEALRGVHPDARVYRLVSDSASQSFEMPQ